MRKLILLILIFISGHLFSQELMNEIKFTQYLQKEAAKSNKKIRIIFFGKLILGSKFNNSSYIHNLKNDYPTYKSDPESLNGIVADLNSRIDSLYAPDPNYHIDTTKIVPLLKPKAILNSFASSDEGEWVHDSFTDELIILYVEDQDSGYLGYRFFSSEELKRSACSQENLHELALRNLNRMLPDYSGYILDQRNYRMYRNVGGEGGSKYLSSLILLPDFLNQEKNRLGQALVLGISGQSQLIIVGKKNRVGLFEVKRLAAAGYFLRKEDIITKNLFLWDGTQLKKYRK
ncbi:MAG: DUF1444 family protein [Bacteroidia bacterium]|nr:DUF1444 family protein [Bacteroidia bacterium]